MSTGPENLKHLETLWNTSAGKTRGIQLAFTPYPSVFVGGTERRGPMKSVPDFPVQYAKAKAACDARHPYRQSTAKEIADEMGIGRVTLWRYMNATTTVVALEDRRAS